MDAVAVRQGAIHREVVEGALYATGAAALS